MLKNLRADVHSSLLKLRSIDRQLNGLTEDFYNELTEKETLTFRLYVINLDPEGLRSYVRGLSSKKLEDKNIRDLRDIASRLGVPSYSMLSKGQLLLEIQEKWIKT